MSHSYEYTEYHLTPNGWISGNTERDPHLVEERVIPQERVLTVKYIEEMPSSFDQLSKYNKIIWQSEDKSKIESLKAKFGDSPFEL